jgi:hypothetical protein
MADYDYCDNCGGACDGVHSVRKQTDDEHVNEFVRLLIGYPHLLPKILKKLREVCQEKKISLE